MDNAQLFVFFVVMGIATFITRALPFVALAQVKGHTILDRFWEVVTADDYGGFGVLWTDES